MAPIELNAIIAQKIEVSPGLFILRVVPDGWELPDFESGQFTVLGLPGTAPRYQFSDEEEPLADPTKIIRRAYSLASASQNKEFIEFYITMVRSGSLTPRLFNLKPGDRVFLSSKFTGLFTLEMVPEDANVILISTGTGLAPYMSMLRAGLDCNGPKKYLVVHGARHSWDLGYRSELITIASVCNNFKYIPAITRPDKEHIKWGGKTGYIQDLWNNGTIKKDAGFDPKPENTHIFLCGNPAMLETMAVDLAKEGFVEHTKKVTGQIHLERYW